jgi:hypothetical protein
METKPAWESLEGHQVARTFATQEDAAAAGAPGAKTYVATEDQKLWFDPKAGEPDPEPGPGESPKPKTKMHFQIGGLPWVVYHYCFRDKADANQEGVLENLALPVPQAIKLNIKPTTVGGSAPGTGNTVPVPLNGPLSPTQKIRRPSHMAGWEIRNIDVQTEPEQVADQAQATAAAVVRIEGTVNKIATKLGV